jgi:hypothetical protein
MSTAYRYSKASLKLFALFGLLLANIPQGRSQGVPVALAPVARQTFWYNGQPNAGGCVFFYNSGTSTPAPTYTDISGTILNSNPVILDVNGAATIYLANQEYTVTVWSNGGTNCATGSQIWSQNGVSAFQVTVGTQTLIFAGVTSDPTGQPGMVDYRIDLGRLRVFNTSWDSIPTDNSVDTLTNKTLTSPIITNPTVTGGTFSNPFVNGIEMVNGPATYVLLANSSTGTVFQQLTKMVNAPSQAQSTAITDTGGVIGITIGGAGTTGTATIQMSGQVSCVFDGATTAGDYVQISSSIGGNCHDTGSGTFPIGGQVIGRVLTTNAAAGSYAIELFSPEIRSAPPGAVTVYSTASSATTGSIGSTTMVTAGSSGNKYIFSVLVTETVLGASCTGNSTVQVSPIYTDAVTGTAAPIGGLIGIGGAAPAIIGTAPVLANSGGGNVNNVIWYFPTPINAKALTTVSYSTIYTGGAGCSPAPTYYVTPILIQVQ